MMYNKLKKTFELVSGIITVVWFSISTLLCVIGLATSIIPAAVSDSYSMTIDMYWIRHNFVSIIITTVLVLGLSITLIVIGAKLCKSRYVENNTKYNNRKKLDITLLVILGIAFIVKIIASTFWSLHTVEVVFFILCTLAIIGLKVTAMCLKPFVGGNSNKLKKQNIQAQATPVSADSLESKLAELKRLRDLGVLTNEQVEAAADRLVEEFIK